MLNIDYYHYSNSKKQLQGHLHYRNKSVLNPQNFEIPVRKIRWGVTDVMGS